MKKSILISIVLFIGATVFSQTGELIGAGVLQFLTSNPNTASKLDPNAKQAMNIIGDLLLVESKRKHDLNYASAGKTEINLTSKNDGSQAKIVLDATGNVYVYYNDQIYPISQNIVNEAKEKFVPKNKVENQFIPPYNISELESNYVFTKAEEFHKVYLINGSKLFNNRSYTIWEVVEKINSFYNISISVESITLLSARSKGNTKNPCKSEKCQKIMDGKVKLGAGRYFSVDYLPGYQDKINVAFTCKWVKDFDEKGLDFQDFQGVKNSFSSDESMLFACAQQTEEDGCVLSLQIIEFATGKNVYSDSHEVTSGANVFYFEISNHNFKAGKYIYNFKLTKGLEKTLASYNGAFEIRESD